MREACSIVLGNFLFFFVSDNSHYMVVVSTLILFGLELGTSCTPRNEHKTKEIEPSEQPNRDQIDRFDFGFCFIQISFWCIKYKNRDFD